MVIHDKSTTISCSRCSEEYTVDGLLYSERTMRRRAAKLGWTVVDEQDVCPRCVQREKHKNVLQNGHFTASQLISFQKAAKEAVEGRKAMFTCPICGSIAKLNAPLHKTQYVCVCTGCGVSYRKE